MDNTNSILLNRFFTRNTFKEAINGEENQTYIAQYVDTLLIPQVKLMKNDISEIYQYLKNEYQNE